MKRVILLSTLGLIAYLLFLAATAPAAVLLNFLPDRSDYTVQSPSGTLWSGRVETVQVAQLRFGPVEWNLSPGHLITGAADIRLRGEVAGGDVTGRLNAKANGHVQVSNLIAQQIDLRTLAPLFQPPANTVTGEGSVRIESLTVSDGRPVSGNGQIRVFDLGINVMGQHQLGTYAGDFTGENGEFTLTFSDAGDQAPFDLEGRLEYVVASGEYSLNGRIRALPAASETLGSALQYLGEPGPEGFRQVNTSGRVRPNPF